MSNIQKYFPEKSQSGNAMIYVLVVVALFAALSFVLSRQNDASEAGGISNEQLEIYAGTIQQAAAQLKQSVEQMTFTGTAVADLNFVTPDDASFNVADPPPAPAHGNKVFHPSGGGVVLPRIPDDAIHEPAPNPSGLPGRWYIGRFSNVEWTPSAAEDVVLTAHEIKQAVCEKINFKLTGSTAIPVLTDPVNEVLIDEAAAGSSATSNIDFTSAECAGCFGKPSLCVKDSVSASWSFYSIIAAE